MTTNARSRHRQRFGQAGAEPQTPPWYSGQLGGFVRGRLAALGEIPSLLEEFGIHSGGPKLEGVPRTFPDYSEVSGLLEESVLPKHSRESEYAELAGALAGPLDVADVAKLGALGAAGLGAGVMRKVSPKRAALDLLGVNKVSAITDVQLRDKSLEDAIQIARQELHVKKGAEGGLVGAPSWVTNRRRLRKMRDGFDAMVDQGVVGADWYKRVRSWIDEVSGGDPAKADRMAQELALFSAQANPDTNLGWAIEIRNALQAGRTELGAAAAQGEVLMPGSAMPRVKTGAQTQKAIDAFTNQRRIKQGLKTGNYESQLNPTADLPTTGTNDIWHGRAFGYTGKEGKPFSRGFTPQEHAFLDAETVLAVDRANQRKLGGRSDWSAGEIQAAAWVYAKGMSAYNKKPAKFGHDPQQAFQWASLTYPDFARKATAQGTYEIVPGAGTGEMQSLLQASESQRQQYTDAVPWTDPQGRDVIYDALLGGNVGKTKPAAGIFFGPQGVETNPANVAKPLISHTKDASGKRVAQPSRDSMTAAEAARSYVDIQNVGAWHKAYPFREGGVKSEAANGIWIPMPRALEVEEMQKLADLTDKMDYFISDSGEGVVLFPAHYNKNPPTGIEMRKKLDAGLRGQLEEMLKDAGKIDRARVDTGSVNMFEDADEVPRPPGSGQTTAELLRHLENPRTPKLLENLDNSPEFRQIVIDKIKMKLKAVSELHSVLWSDRLRADHMRALEIIAAEGFKGLRKALDNGQILPAVALPIFGIAFETASDSET